ncbi:MAG: TonB family protein [Myxococcota bacterium]
MNPIPDVVVCLLLAGSLACQSPAPSNALKASRPGRPARGETLDCSRFPEDRIAFSHRVPPRYPKNTSRGGLEEGFVELRFDVGPDGVPINIRVGRSSLGRRFDAPARKAFVQWRLCPREAGKRDLKVRIQFEPGSGPGGSLPLDTRIRGLR